MNERKGVVFSIPEENLPVEGCTISKEVAHERDYHLFYFSLAAHTDISPETVSYTHLADVVVREIIDVGTAGEIHCFAEFYADLIGRVISGKVASAGADDANGIADVFDRIGYVFKLTFCSGPVG